MTALLHTMADLSVGLRDPRAVVMTMGALHEGHASLIRAARERMGEHGQVVVTIFVNPLQFGPNEDFDAYPRTLAEDLEVARVSGADAVFAPSAATMYPTGPPETTVVPGKAAQILEGEHRQGHFTGMLTVVAKLLNLTSPKVAFFGEKDYQQLTLIKQMVADLNMPCEIVGVATSRESDGLARSSRNVYLSSEQRRTASAIPRALAAAVRAAESGARADGVLAAARGELSGVDLDYLQLRAPDLSAAPSEGEARLLVAARLGQTRLLDNVAVTLGGGR